LVFSVVKSFISTTYKYSDVPTPDIFSIITQNTITVFIFHGIIYEFIPDNTLSDITLGFITYTMSPQTTISIKISQAVFRTFMSMSRRKYPLYIILLHNIFTIYIFYIISLHKNNFKYSY
jgi:hypothetical protein